MKLVLKNDLNQDQSTVAAYPGVESSDNSESSTGNFEHGAGVDVGKGEEQEGDPKEEEDTGEGNG